MPFPSVGPTTLDLVKAQMHVTDAVDDALVTRAVDAVNQVVQGLRIAQAANVDPAPADWNAWPRIILGATMLAARVARRTSTPDGVAPLAQAVYVLRNDPEVAQMLQVGDYAKPAVG